MPNAAQVGVVWLEHVVDPFAPVGCWFGTGVLLTNDTILTAGHVADYDLALQKCAANGEVPKYLRITMPASSLPGDSQVRVISCGISSLPPDKWKEGCGAKFVASYQTSASASLFTRGEDAALIQVVNGFVVNGKSAFYSRHLSAATTSSFYNTQVTCYGMSDSAPVAPKTTGALRKADFTVLPYPHPLTGVTQAGTPTQWLQYHTDTMFAVSRGGGLTPTPETDGGAYYPIPVEGDSGGPCIKHTTGVDGDIVGIDQAGEDVKNPSSPSYAHYTATTASNAVLRHMVRAGLGVQAGQVFADLDLGGVPDDSVEVQVSPTNTIQIVVRFDNGATSLPPFDTLIPVSAAPFAGTYFGDFDANGFADIVASVGKDGLALPFYFNGATPAGFSFTNAPTWQPNGPYEYLTVGRFNDDTVDDVAAARFDGTEDVFLGEPGVGLTVPAQYVPRGFNWYGPGDQEAVAIAAPGFSSNLVTGATWLLTNPGSGLEANGMDLSVLKKTAPNKPPLAYNSALGDLFGEALTWGKFDSASANTPGDTLVIGAPGVAVGGNPGAGVVALFRFNKSYAAPDPFDLVELNHTMFPSASAGGFGSRLAAGDFDGDGRDDLVVGSPTDLTVLQGAAGGIKASSVAQVFAPSQLGLAAATVNGGLTTGDFNCDGYEDLAVGVPTEPGARAGAGAVVVLYGSKDGLDAAHRQRLDKSVPGLTTFPVASDDEAFGEEIVAGNFNGDGYVGRPCVDLAISVGEGTGSIRSGAVYVVYGGADGLNPSSAQRLAEGATLADGSKILDQPDPGDGFGLKMAITRADLDRKDDLVVGVYNENSNAGAAHVLRGSAAGITATGEAFLRQGYDGVPGVGQTGPNPLSGGSKFGWTVGGTANGLIAVGASWESYATADRAGWAALLRVNDTAAQANPPEIKVGAYFEANEQLLGTVLNPVPLRNDSFFGFAMTKPRPAFVPQTADPPRYSGQLVLTGGHRLDLACVNDHTPPVLDAVTATPACLWPVNHKLVAYGLGSGLQYHVTDDCDPNPSVRIVDVQSSEAGGKGPPFVFGDHGACLRAERLGTGSGRTYTLTVEARDANGNTAQSVVSVLVPKDATAGCSVPPGAFVKDGDPSCAF